LHLNSAPEWRVEFRVQNRAKQCRTELASLESRNLDAIALGQRSYGALVVVGGQPMRELIDQVQQEHYTYRLRA